MSVANKPTLAIYSNVTAIVRSNGNVILAGRLISGMEEHGKYWPGDMLCVCEPAREEELATNADRTLGGDNVEISPSDLPFRLAVVDFQSDDSRRLLAGVSVAIVGIGHRVTHMSAWGRELNVPVIYGSEYSLKTRLQIVRAETSNPVTLARRILWNINLERKQKRAIGLADGIQCNGTPTYDAYRPISRNAMLFFDGRMTEEMLVTEADQAERHARLHRGEPLRLAWSGRLNRMKGAHHLPTFAAELKKLGVPFTLEIFGGGVLEAALRKEVAERGLGDCVDIKGYVKFDSVLTPHLQKHTDVWVCPHVQGDPSGAFLETFGSGLPIIGFDSEALTGMLRLVDAGCTVPLADAGALAAAVAEASRDREALVNQSIAARSFAIDHTFEKSFMRRMAHIDKVLSMRV